jgi:hypothetical protein
MVDDPAAPGGQRPVLSLSVSAILPTDISHEFETNSLLVDFGTPIVFVDTVANPAMLSESLFEDLAPLLVELVLPILTQAIEGVSLPTFDVGADTYRMQINDIFYIGSSGDFVGAFGAWRIRRCRRKNKKTHGRRVRGKTRPVAEKCLENECRSFLLVWTETSVRAEDRNVVSG